MSRVQTLGSAKKLALRRVRGARELFIHVTGGLTAFGDGPNDERLAPSRAAHAEDSWNAGHVVVIRKDVASWVKLEVELFDHAALLRAEKAEGLLDSQSLQASRESLPSVLYPV